MFDEKWKELEEKHEVVVDSGRSKPWDRCWNTNGRNLGVEIKHQRGFEPRAAGPIVCRG